MEDTRGSGVRQEGCVLMMQGFLPLIFGAGCQVHLQSELEKPQQCEMAYDHHGCMEMRLPFVSMRAHRRMNMV